MGIVLLIPWILVHLIFLILKLSISFIWAAPAPEPSPDIELSESLDPADVPSGSRSVEEEIVIHEHPSAQEPSPLQGYSELNPWMVANGMVVTNNQYINNSKFTPDKGGLIFLDQNGSDDEIGPKDNKNFPFSSLHGNFGIDCS